MDTNPSIPVTKKPQSAGQSKSMGVFKFKILWNMLRKDIAMPKKDWEKRYCARHIRSLTRSKISDSPAAICRVTIYWTAILVCLQVIWWYLSSQIIIPSLNNKDMLPCFYVLSRMMTEFGVILDKQILYDWNIKNEVKKQIFDAHNRR